MLLQCPKCRLNARIPSRLEGTAVECPHCGATGFAGRRPGGLANLKPLPEPAEAAAIDDYLDHIETELAGLVPEELFNETLRCIAFYDLPGEPPYEEMLRKELAALVKKASSPSENRHPPHNAQRVRTDAGQIPARELIAAAGAPSDPTGTCAGVRNAGYAERRACPRVEATELAAAIEDGHGRFPLGNISVSGIWLAPSNQTGLRKDDRVRLRLVHGREETMHVPDNLLRGLGAMTARVVRIDDGVGLAFEKSSGFASRRLAGLVARLARQRNETSIPSMQEAQGF